MLRPSRSGGRRRPTISRLALAALVCLGSLGAAHAQTSGAWSGTLALAPGGVSAPAALALTQSGRSVVGTLAVQAGDPALDGSYQLQGRVIGRRVRLAGFSASGVRVVVRGVAQGARFTARGRLTAPGRRLRVRLALSRQTASADGSACDAVFTQNEATFTQLTDQVLAPVCAACHTAGGQATSTRLRVTPGDPLATARSVATVVDPTDPASSLLVAKPTGTVPHGGGLRVTPGSAEADLLLEWATLVSSAGCVPTGGGGAGEPFAVHCASCHGADGSGLGNAPDVRCTTPGLLRAAVRSGRGSAMPAFSRAVLPERDLRAMIADLGARCSGAPQDIYAANCARCHGARAGGGAGGPPIGCGELGSLREVLASGEEGMPAFRTLVRRAGRLSRWLGGVCRSGGGD